MVIEHGAMPRFSMDGDQFVFEEVSPGRGIWIANADGSYRRQVAEKSQFGAPASPALSPDGRSVAFFKSELGPIGDIWVTPSEGGTPRRLTFNRSEGGGPVWTPDGRFIIFYSSHAGSQTLWRIPAEGGTSEAVTTGAGQDRDPDISRDGRRVVYSNFRVTNALVLHDSVTGQQRELLQRRHLVGMPRFSPDGSRIAFSQQSGSDVHVFTIGIDGKDIRQVTEGAGQQNLVPHWSGDASWLHFVQSRPIASVRKVSALGGDSVEVGSWSSAEVDPYGVTVAYPHVKEQQTSATVIRQLATGSETVLDMVLNSPRWSPDAQTIVGWQPAPEAGTSRVVSCAVRQGTCQVLMERGSAPVVVPDGTRILFLRQAGTLGARELWSIRPDGHDAKQIALLRPFGLDATFDVSRRGEIVFVQRRETRAELWQADLR
jgi:Tol biopolymer transport system component